MGNSNSVQKLKMTNDQDEARRVTQRLVGITERSRSPDGRKSSTGSSSEVSWTSAHEDPEEEEEVEDLVIDDDHHHHHHHHHHDSLLEEHPLAQIHADLPNQASTDDFMRAVLSFCSYMDGRMDSLDNSKLYEEFCNYTASHSARIGVV